MAALSAKQELFAQGLMRGLSQREAYKLAGYVYTSDKSTDAAASQALRSITLQERLREMQQAALISERVTAQTVTIMLQDVFNGAKRDKQHGAAATAAMGIAKLHGLLVDRIEDVTRRPTRDPDAPLEIEVEHWLTEHKLLPDGSNGSNGHANGVDTVARGSASPGTDADYQKDDAITDVPPSDDPASGD